MIHLNFLGDMYCVQGKKHSGFLLANKSLEEIRKSNVYVHGAGISGFEARSLLASNGIEVLGISDNNPMLAGRFIGDKKIISPPAKDSFIVAAIPYNHFWVFKSQMKVMGVKEWGIYVSPVFNPSPHTDGQCVFDALLSAVETIMNDTANFGATCFEDFIKFYPPHHYGDVEKLFRSIGGSHSVLKWMHSEIPSDKQGVKLLDIGPGWGVHSNFIKNLRPMLQVDWLTLNASHRRVENSQAQNKRGVPENQYLGIIEDPEFTLNEQYDFIILTEVFEHFASNPVNVMRNIRRLLKDDGRVFFSTPNWGPLWIYGSWREMKPFDEFADIAQYSDSLFPHTYQYDKHELTEVLTEAGFEILKHEVNPNNYHCALLGKA